MCSCMYIQLYINKTAVGTTNVPKITKNMSIPCINQCLIFNQKKQKQKNKEKQKKKKKKNNLIFQPEKNPHVNPQIFA